MTTPLIALGGTLSFAGNLIQGYSAYRSSKTQGENVLEQGRIVYRESLRDANITREEGERFAAKQSLEFIGNGFQLGGTGLIITNQTLKFAETEAQAQESRGLASLFLAERESDRIQDEGRAALISGVIKGAGNLISGFAPR